MKNKILVSLMLLLFCCQSAFALFGARPMGMGGAFTAVANDANAAYWNPAGLALNPEVSITGSTMLSNRNMWVGDNVANLKMCYDTEMNPFQWILGMGAAAAIALESAKYLSDQGVVQKGWGNSTPGTARDQSFSSQVNGTEEIVALKKKIEDLAKRLGKSSAKAVKDTASNIVKNTDVSVVIPITLGESSSYNPGNSSGISALWNGTWYPVTLLGQDGNKFKVHYVGYGDNWDEWVTADKIKIESGLDLSNNPVMVPVTNPVYTPDKTNPNYWEQHSNKTHAQFAAGLSLLNDYNPPLDQKSNWYSITMASGFEQMVAVGANVNFYDMTKISTNIRGAGADLDLGVIVRPAEALSFGLVTKGVLTTDIVWQDSSRTRYQMLVNAGVAVKPIKALTVACDGENVFNQQGTMKMHYGAELTVLPGVLVRGGLSDGSKTAGASVAIDKLILDYAYLGGAYAKTQMVGMTWKF
ncbi:MAG: Tudor-knot domain-containing protein [Candidatus Margulisiibacteriota bacterium]